MQNFAAWEPFPLFDGITAASIQGVFECIGMRTGRYGGQETVLHAGERTERFGLVLTGAIRVIREDYQGAATLLAAIGPGEIFAEAFAIGGEPLSVSVQAAQIGAEILWIPHSRLSAPCQKACPAHAALLTNLMRLLAQKNLFLNSRIEHLSRRTLREKALSYLAEEARRQGGRHFKLPLDRQGMADYLACDRSALSAVLCRLREEGVIAFHKDDFTLL